MDRDELQDRLHRAAAWLDASPAEVAGLAVLLAGVVAVAGALWWWSTPRAVEAPAHPAAGSVIAPTAALPTAAPTTVTVHVAGAVSTPGLVAVPAGARVADAITAAGGPAADAALDALNLARPVTDGERLEVPRIGEAPVEAGSGPTGTGEGGTRPDGTVDLNLATAADLEALPGIGPVLAERILAWREEHGGFKEVGQLREVAGIGEATFQRLSSLVVV